MITSALKLMMGSSVATPPKPPAYVGAIVKEGYTANNWSLNVMSIASPGDLVVIAFTLDTYPDSSWSWSGMDITAVENRTGSSNPGSYVGYKFVEAGDSNPEPVGVGNGNWRPLNVVAAVFEGVTGYVSAASAGNSWSGTPNPPSLTANGDLWVCTGHLEDDIRELDVAPSGYTLAGSAFYNNPAGPAIATTGIAYKISTLTSDDPGNWGSSQGTLNDSWRATTMAFTGNVE